MGGSGGGGSSFFDNASPEELRKAILKAEKQSTNSAFEVDLAAELAERLAAFNDRDVEGTRRRLDKVKAAIASDVEGVVDVLLGGSVAKHTYVDGLSDIDALLLVNRTELANDTPIQILKYLEGRLRETLKDAAHVRSDKMAITVDYTDGTRMELLPALKTPSGVRIASADGKSWSNIAPEKFAAALTRHNERCGGKLIPVVKLAKAINATLPLSQQLTGYHMESLGIEAFRGYEGTFTPAAMLRHYFDRAKTLVLQPIKDTSGQTLHVDDYLGPKNGEARRRVAHLMDRISRRIANASAAQSVDQWRDILGEVGR